MPFLPSFYLLLFQRKMFRNTFVIVRSTYHHHHPANKLLPFDIKLLSCDCTHVLFIVCAKLNFMRITLFRHNTSFSVSFRKLCDFVLPIYEEIKTMEYSTIIFLVENYRSTN